MDVKEFLSHLDGVRGSGGQYTARCPAHQDAHNSLSVGFGADGRLLIKCHAGCDTGAILEAMGLSMKDLFIKDTGRDAFPDFGGMPAGKQWKEAEYVYPGGTVRKVKVRHEDGGKHFYWQHMEGGQWQKGRGPDAPLYYRRALDGPVAVVEGEKDVDTLSSFGMAAVSLPDGAKSKWRDSYGAMLAGKPVYIIPDNDKPGREYGQTLARNLHGLASSVKVLELSRAWPGMPEHGDVTDMIDHMGDHDGLKALTELMKAAPEWTEGQDGKPALINAADVPYEPPRWTIAPYFQQGKGTLIQGDNGSGKTAFMCAVAAHVTTGEPLLGLPIATPGNVLMLSVEDDLPVLRGRVEASGGDLRRCFFMANSAGLSFSSPEIEDAIKQIQAKMVIFDPFQAFLGARVDMFRSNETRPVLAKLFEMCERHACACAIVAHMGKSVGDKSPVNRSLGSVDIPAAMRSVLQLTRNPDNEEERVMVHIKCSNAPRGPSIAYTIGDRGGVHWTGFSPMTVEDLTILTRRKEKGVDYDREPLVQVFNQLIAEKPGGGFWSYADLKSEGARILGFPPFGDLSDLRGKLDRGLARELQQKDGLIVTHSAKGRGNVRGVRVEQYEVPKGYQTKMEDNSG
ncbi:MAG: AAA family ATPase [Oscillospiraceae bacterium]|nr:AAA family ATPase [Oscillospiraceae bacterium]